MDDEEHEQILRQGVDAWNQWRQDNSRVKPDLYGAYLEGANLSGANLNRADLNRANLNRANLSGADLFRANLWKADLSGAVLSKANLIGAELNRVKLHGADLRGACLAEADLSEADLSVANLSRANLRGTDFTSAICEQANFSGADLSLARLLRAHLTVATLTGARLWETQRAHWYIDGVVCESIYWDEVGGEPTTYGPGEFEQLYSAKIIVLVRYPGGISPLEVVTLPALIRQLEASRPGCKLRFESIQDGPGGSIVTIVVEDAGDIPPGQIDRLKAEIKAEAEQKTAHLREALESEKESVLLLKGEVRTLERTLERIVDKFLSRPTFYLQGGDARMGDEYNVGQAGAVGPQAHAHDMTFQQVGGNIESAMDLSELAAELATLRRAMKSEATEPEHDAAVGEVAKAEQAATAKDSSKVAESLKAAGKWALDVATKIGTSLASEALKESLGIKK